MNRLQTLAISTLSAVTAAIVVPLFWQTGTIIATAVTPVAVALVSEALRRPVRRIGEVMPRVTHRTAAHTTSAQAAHAPAHPTRHSRWRLGLIIGAAAFVIGGGVVTALELTVFGSSISGAKERTSLFGGRTHPSTPAATPTPGASATPKATPTPTPSTSPTPTPTPTATPTATPSPTSTPPAAARTTPTP